MKNLNKMKNSTRQEWQTTLCYTAKGVMGGPQGANLSTVSVNYVSSTFAISCP